MLAPDDSCCYSAADMWTLAGGKLSNKLFMGAAFALRPGTRPDRQPGAPPPRVTAAARAWTRLPKGGVRLAGARPPLYEGRCGGSACPFPVPPEVGNDRAADLERPVPVPAQGWQAPAAVRFQIHACPGLLPVRPGGKVARLSEVPPGGRAAADAVRSVDMCSFAPMHRAAGHHGGVAAT